MEKFKFQLEIVRESYEYNEEEIVYRIYFEDQIISERSLPVLQINQAMTDNFVLELNNDIERKNLIKLTNFTIYNSLYFINLKNKKSFIKKITVNNEIEHIQNYKNMKDCFLTALTVNSINIAFHFRYNGFHNK
jgi:hypothetical protein